MQTADERLARLEAFVKRIACIPSCSWPTPELIAEADTLVRDRVVVDPRFDKVLSAIYVARPAATEDSARRLARDILAALDA